MGALQALAVAQAWPVQAVRRRWPAVRRVFAAV